MQILLTNEWKNALKSELEKEYFLNLKEFLNDEYSKHIIYPPESLVFNALNMCRPQDCKVVILGQDPYHGPGQAHGLSFSVNDGVKFPPSLRNIFKELRSDLNVDVPFSGNLEKWAKQGVLLLNATLTVRAGQAGSHQKKGWEIFTDSTIEELGKKYSGIAFVLWGSYASKKESLIDQEKHLVIKSAHPSPLSAHRGFFDSKPFSKVNSYLISQGREPIEW
ncbi:uracil-DNA glycosylase [Marinigracilibium pacificum]|uniref:Uracil-DNA glycosylase n=1 Tax=Marinigracilibium pacificum TaxID=2729599 RepID=A0A848J4F0_9BACT|nr:uracil-DNA glycosylase [Marinigracilibium pacificum]NMM50596.1 uracil-DNA glycosylase [Marinigracilibium pacificum]